MSIWDKIYELSDKKQEHIALANILAEEWTNNGHIKKTCREMLELDDEVIILFYKLLSEGQSIESPIATEKDSKWMLEKDFCFINVRATGLGDRYGNFITAAKLLPVIRANAIHLGPFTSYDFGTIYAITSVSTISKDVVDFKLWEKGIYPEMQLKAFVDACHILNKCVGFDIEPHVSQFAKTVLEHPKYFRWIALDKNHMLKGGMTQNEMLNQSNQNDISRDVEKIVKKRLSQEGLNTLESQEQESIEQYNKKENIYFSIITEIIRNGYWTIPSQIWNGDGVPAYDGYNSNGNYAQFLCLDRLGKNMSDCAFNIVTPYYFYENIKVNQKNENTNELVMNEETIKFYGNIFKYWRDSFSFDFIRHDSMDHIFDSIDKNGKPMSDRATPEVIRACIRCSKDDNKEYIGNLAERMGYEYDKYKEAGYDLILGNEMMENITDGFMSREFDLNRRLMRYNENNRTASVTFATDTHDTGDGHLWGKPLIELEGIDGMRVRQFVARFMQADGVTRPKYEVMGAQDLSYGLFMSNIDDLNINWIGNEYFNKVYNYIEDTYDNLKEQLLNGRLIQYNVDCNYCWWIIDAGNKLIIPVVSTENGHGVDYINIDLSDYAADVKSISVHDFYKCQKFNVNDSNERIQIYNLNYRQCLLYEVIKK